MLDIDFDGAAPASADKQPATGMSGLEGLAGTPVRAQSPAVSAPQQSNNLDDLLGVFGNGGNNNATATASANGSNTSALADLSGGSGGDNDLLNGFSSLNVNNNPTSPGTEASNGGKKTNEDIMSLF